MRAIMVMMFPYLTSAYQVRRVRISLPLVEPLLDGEKYFLPGDQPAPSGEDLRAFTRPKLDNGRAIPMRPRGPLWTSLMTGRARPAGAASATRPSWPG